MTDHLEQIKELLPKYPNISIEDDFIEKIKGFVEPTPMAEENKTINSQVCYEKAFQELFIEILKFDMGFVNAKKNFTEALLNSGAHDNPQGVYQLLELITTRLERIHVVKRVCGYLGLHNEMDRILEKEMELIYKTPQYNISRQLDLSMPIAGEHIND